MAGLNRFRKPDSLKPNANVAVLVANDGGGRSSGQSETLTTPAAALKRYLCRARSDDDPEQEADAQGDY